MRLESGDIKNLPEEQIKDGITSIDELEERYKHLSDMIYSSKSMAELSTFTDFEIDLLSAITGKSTHSFRGSGKSVKQMIEEFQRDRNAGNIAELSPEYQSVTITADKAGISFDVNRIQEDYDVLKNEVLDAANNPKGLSVLKGRAANKIGKKLDELVVILEKHPNPHLQSQVDKLNKVKINIENASTIDELMIPLLQIDSKTANKYGLTVVMRQIVFRKIFEKNYSPEIINNVISNLQGQISGQSILTLINLVDHIAKAHIINIEGNNEERYWTDEAWKAIRNAKKGKNTVNLVHVFAPHAGKLRKEADNFTIIESGISLDIEVIPDRGFIGEMSGYLANACYTAEYPLLRRYPNVTPYKFVVPNESGDDKKLFGSVLAFELEEDTGEKIMLVRAFNVPNESEINIGKFIEDYLDRLTEVASARGITKIVVPSFAGAISNYQMTINHMSKNYISGKKPINLSKSFTFNGYNLTRNCYVARVVGAGAVTESRINEENASVEGVIRQAS